MSRAAIALFLLGLALVATSCREDTCKSAEPAFQLDVLLAAGVDSARVTRLTVSIDASGLHKEQTLDVTGKLGDGSTSFAASMGSKVKGAFTVDIAVEGRDAQGRTLARGQGRYPATGDACNFFSLTLTSVAVDAGRDGPVDGPTGDRVDVRPDARRDVRRVDSSPADSRRDLPSIACKTVRGVAGQNVSGLSSGGKYVFACEYPAAIGPITQCEAASACAPPSKLCTLAAYESALSSAVIPAAIEWGWLAACVRRKGTLTWDPAAVCDATCDTSISTLTAPLMTDCTGTKYPSQLGNDAGCGSVANNVGLTSYTLNWCFFSPSMVPGPFAPSPVSGVGGVGGNGKTLHEPRRALCCYP